MKYILRILTFIFTFLIALNISWAIYNVNYLDGVNSDLTENCEKFCLLPKLKSLVDLNPNGEVEVRFIKFNDVDNDLVAEFEVINNSASPIFYTDYNYDINSIPGVIVDGVEVEKERFMCGTGLSTYHIHSGDSLKIRVSSESFTSYIDKEGKLKMGFDYYNDSNKSDNIYWSQEFEIPESIKAKIRKEIAIVN